MPRRSKAFLAHSHAAKLGWQRRKRAERAEFKRRSLAAKQGWLTRKRNVRGTSRRRVERPAPAVSTGTRQRASQIMWRVTVSAPYYRRERGKRTRNSISSSYMVRSWLNTRRSAEDAIDEDELTELAIEGRQEILESQDRVWWTGNDDTVDIKIEKVSYDERLLDTIEETNEL